jgi:hypothetical protein
MKEVISMKEVPFDFPFKSHLKNEIVKKSQHDQFDFYYITSPSIHIVYSYCKMTKKPTLVIEFSMSDVYEALENQNFRSKLEDYLSIRTASTL